MTWGQVTSTIYGLIRDSKYIQAIKVLDEQIRIFPESQAATSLLGYCHYMNGDYHAATSMYDQLVRLHPTEEKYRVYLAQAMYKADMLNEAAKVCVKVEGHRDQTINLQACILFCQGDITGCTVLLEQIAHGSVDALINLGCCFYKEGNFEAALAKFTAASKLVGFQPNLAYMRTLCMFKLKQFSEALHALTEIFNHGLKEYPELGIVSSVEGVEPRSVGNSHTLRESALIEAFNLKAAILYMNGDINAAKEALDDMPPRDEEELDPVTLHNQALANMDANPTIGFRKLNFLLQNQCFPPEAFGNLLLLCCKPFHGLYDLAADVMAENAHLTFQHLTQELYDFLDATILVQTDAEEAFTKFNKLAYQHGEALCQLRKLIQDSQTSKAKDSHMQAVSQDYEEALSENKYKEAMSYYEPIVKEAGVQILTVTAIVLANLCVCYIMTNQNEDAEDLMQKIEKEEERAHYIDSSKQNLHLCIVNLVIGTLYCVKQNFEYGIGRIIKSLKPCAEKLDADTWFYAKRCFLALTDNLAKHMIVLKDTTQVDMMDFLEQAAMVGKGISTQASNMMYHSCTSPPTATTTTTTTTTTTLPGGGGVVAVGHTVTALDCSPCVAQEACLLQCMLLQLQS
nr:tetratricopeptide repeat protein 30B-like isoform X3 [Physcomitrium patens]|eukprot:XP_024400097.1 tetratricopeptide repeat protein 30B-like isoform X3 [Physcomitrella patens]